MILKVTIVTYAVNLGWSVPRVSFSIYNSKENQWQSTSKEGPVASGGGDIPAGSHCFILEVSDDLLLGELWLSGAGSCDRPGDQRAIFVAEPPQGRVSDQLAYAYGPPWISLSALGSALGMSGEIYVVNGGDPRSESNYPYQIGMWAIEMVY